MANILLLGLDDQSAETIAKFSLQAGHAPRREAMRTTWETRPEEDVVFISGDQSSYRDALESIRRFRAAPPVIVMSRLGEASGWIDALEAGATDFLSAPYTFRQVAEVVANAASHPKAFAA